MTLTYTDNPMYTAAVLHGSGYVGRELIALLLHHPNIDLQTVVSGSGAGKPISDVHPTLRGFSDLTFVSMDEADLSSTDVVFVAGIPGTGVAAEARLSSIGFKGILIDMSTDFRFRDPVDHLEWNGVPHPDPTALGNFVYGLPEILGPYPTGTRLIANPGCFATGLALSVYPLAQHLDSPTICVTALTGASGSGATPSKTTHFPDRDGNVRSYKVFTHRHLGEVYQAVGGNVEISFIPVSGPWTRGIWGTVQLTVADGTSNDEVTSWFVHAYDEKPFVRLWENKLPELRYAVGSPFCDIGWTLSGDKLAVVFALDNLLKGAASQAIQNANLALSLPETSGLLPKQLAGSLASEWV